MPRHRQLAAIMFTDIVGFTFLMGKDESHGLAVLESNRAIHRDCLTAHQGLLVKEIGDGMLCRFDSAVDAIHCALAIQQRMAEQDFRLRIGIHLGDVVLSEEAADVYGNTVNIANRVEALANPGGVFVTEQVVESTRGIDGLRFAFLGEQSLKNVETAVRIFGLEHPHLTKPELSVFLDDSISRDIQQYHLVEKLAVGGMGIVYKAFDTKLERYVALKFLSSQLNRDETSRERFLQEARSAAALQHPHICTIHEIDETSEGRHFIAMELVEGPTLREYLEREGPLPPRQAVELALQLAEGLQHAHRAGVVHRDIKPENIKIPPEGGLKILDFGLALSGDASRTRFGSRAGTVAYMSPEQARGEPLDHRTDIWSFGVVLFRMLTGRLPFDGEYEHVLLHAILHDPPIQLRDTHPHLPPALTELDSWCLEKEADLRVQTARDLVAALQRLRRDFDRTPSPAPGRPAMPPQWSRRLTGRPWLLPLVVAVALAAGGLLGASLWEGEGETTTPPTSMTPFTVLGGLSSQPVWSPDGQWIAYVSNENGSMDLWKKPVAGGKAERLTRYPGNETDPAWSPDGRSIAFRRDGPDGGLFIIPADGGTDYRLTTFGRAPAWSPDSRRVAFAAYGNVYLVPAAGGDLQVLVEGTSANPRPVWTADGQRILFWHRTRGDIHVAPAAGGPARPLGLIPSGQEVSSLCVNRAGDRLLYSMGPFGGHKDLYEVAIDPATSEKTAAVRHLTVTPTDDTDGVYGPEGRHIAFTARTLERHLYRLPLDRRTGLAAGEPEALTRHGKMNYYPDLSADGERLLWTSHRSGQGNLYSSALNDTIVGKVTDEWRPDVREISGRFDPASEQVIFASTLGGSYQLWRVHSVGSVGLPITETEHPQRDVHPALSPDGSSVLFYSNRAGTWDIWRLDLNGEDAPRPLTDWPGNELYPSWAPDGRSLAFSADRSGNADIWRMDAAGKVESFVHGPAEELWGAWSPDQRWFFFVTDRDGNYNVWRTPGEGGEAAPVTSFNAPDFGLPENSIFTKFAAGDGLLIIPLEERKGDVYVLSLEF